jgi:uridine kinase
MRRSANKFLLDQKYFSKVLLPMHRAYVEQTKKYADVVIDVAHKDADEVFRILDETMLHWWGSEVCKNDEEVF